MAELICEGEWCNPTRTMVDRDVRRFRRAERVGGGVVEPVPRELAGRLRGLRHTPHTLARGVWVCEVCHHGREWG